MPVQAPDQPANVEPESGVAVRDTVEPMVNEDEQVAPQLIPVGELVMTPTPVPDLETVRVGFVVGGGASEELKVAVTV